MQSVRFDDDDDDDDIYVKNLIPVSTTLTQRNPCKKRYPLVVWYFHIFMIDRFSMYVIPFPWMEHPRTGKIFRNKRRRSQKTPDFFKRVIENLASRWTSTVVNESDYMFDDDMKIVLTYIYFHIFYRKNLAFEYPVIIGRV